MIKDKRGLTMLEILVVVLIIGIISVFSVQGYTKYVRESKLNTDLENAKIIKNALEAVATDPEVYREIIHIPRTDDAVYYWSEPINLDITYEDVFSHLWTKSKEFLPDGVPGTQSKDKQFRVILHPNQATGTVDITVDVVDK